MTNKERLESIKEDVEIGIKVWGISIDAIKWMIRQTEEKFKLEERVQELEDEIENLETDLWHANHFKNLANQKNAIYRVAFKQIKLQILFDGAIEDHRENIIEIIDEALGEDE